ncbi:hypothetical protein HOLleu_40549 [Holothuria leucospilota]|uniref:Uncharacterized protein n=1 Tax=Holothuria leucospilota TaxID=206669 RepID=A0A9Q0YDS3_HOLLE|nr:hypothetical protein HOLleu_40549 [Holothuria leucospilota]
MDVSFYLAGFTNVCVMRNIPDVENTSQSRRNRKTRSPAIFFDEKKKLILNEDISYIFGTYGGEGLQENYSNDLFIISGSTGEEKTISIPFCRRKCFNTYDGHYHCPICSFDLFEYYLIEGERPNTVDTCTWKRKTAFQQHLHKDHGAEKMDGMVTIARFKGKRSVPENILAKCPANYLQLVDEMKRRKRNFQPTLERYFKSKKARLDDSASSDDKESNPFSQEM